jgi:competence protein ComEA
MKKNAWHMPSFFVGLLVGLLVAGMVLLLQGQWVGGGVPIELVPLPPRATQASTVLLTVHVVGAVKMPGVYALEFGSRTQDAIAAAGGALEDADLSVINLAQELADGQQVKVPGKADFASAPISETTEGENTPSNLVNINTADQATLESLPRVGVNLATAILSDRNTHGPFATVQDLQRVPGITADIFAVLEPLITVGP